MSSSLYKIHIKAIIPPQVSTRIYIVHPDVNEIPDTKTFALNILIEAWRNMLHGFFFKDESYLPISPEEAQQRAENAQYSQQWKLLERMANGYREAISKQDYRRIQSEDQPFWKGQRIQAWGSDGKGQPFVMMPEDLPALQEKANELISQVKLENKLNFPWKPEPANLNDEDYEAWWYQRFQDENVPQADLVFQVADQQLLDFLPQDTWWESTIYQ